MFIIAIRMIFAENVEGLIMTVFGDEETGRLGNPWELVSNCAGKNFRDGSRGQEETDRR